jgi:hypothetical protein
MPTLSRLAVLTVAALVPTSVALVSPLSVSAAKPKPVKASMGTHRLLPASEVRSAQPLSARDSSEARQRAHGRAPRVASASAPVGLPSDLAVVGVTWKAGTAPEASVQYRTQTGGRWGAWEFLESDAEHGPDAAEKAKAGERDGSAPLVVSKAAQVQVRVLAPASGSAPVEPELAVIDPGTSAADGAVGTAQPGAATAAAKRPYIYTRKQWGADESLRDPAVAYGGVKAAFVHHTVDSNGYSSSQVPALIRGIYSYHVKGRGWNDIGYNFLVDRFGRTWEGRYGGITRPVIGAHTAGVNSYSFGVAAIGNHDAAGVPTATTNAIKALIGWKAQIHEFNPLGKANLAGTVVNAVSGHRDAYSTSCPGRYLYAQVPSIRATAGALVRGLPSLSLDRDLDNLNNADIVATTPGNDLLLYQTTNSGTVAGPVYLGRGGWKGVDEVSVAGDLTGDGAADLVARWTSTGQLKLYPGNGGGLIGSGRTIGNGWQIFSDIIAPGDWTGDGRPDLLGRMRSDGSLRLYPGNGAGGFGASRAIGQGWGGMRLISGIGDWDGDGGKDLLAVASNGTARVYRGNGAGGFRGFLALGGDWSAYRSVVGVGDATWDTRVDLFAVSEDGVASMGRMGSSVGQVAWTRLGSGWSQVDVYSG